MKRSSSSSHWSIARLASSAVTTAPPGTSGTPQTSVISAAFPSSPRQRPITSSLRSIFQSGFSSASSAVKSTRASNSLGPCDPSLNATKPNSS